MMIEGEINRNDFRAYTTCCKPHNLDKTKIWYATSGVQIRGERVLANELEI